MQIVELGDCSMVIMKDYEDPPWASVGQIYRKAKKHNDSILVYSKRYLDSSCPYEVMISWNYIYTAGRLILYFEDTINNESFHLHDKVTIYTLVK